MKWYEQVGLYNWTIRILVVSFICWRLFYGLPNSTTVGLSSLGLLIVVYLWFNPLTQVSLKTRRIYSKFMDLLLFILSASVHPYLYIAWIVIYISLEIGGKSTPSKYLFDLQLYDASHSTNQLPIYYVLLRYGVFWSIPMYFGLTSLIDESWVLVISIVTALTSAGLLLFNFTEAADTLRAVKVRDSRDIHNEAV